MVSGVDLKRYNFVLAYSKKYIVLKSREKDFLRLYGLLKLVNMG